MTATAAARALNRAGYDAIAENWDRRRGAMTLRERALFELALQSVRSDRVVDLGCGTGRPVADLILERGLRPVGVDQSAGMLAIARRRLPWCEWIHETIEQFSPAFDVSCVIAWDSIFHIPSDDHFSLFQKVRGWLPIGAPFLLTVGGTAGDAFTAGMFGRVFYFDSPDPQETQARLADAGFEVDVTEVLDVPAHSGDRGRVAVLARAA